MEPDDFFKCSICRIVPDNPFTCDHNSKLYCSTCLIDCDLCKNIEPNAYMKQYLNRLAIMCPNKKCSQIMTRGEYYNAHMNNCAHREVECEIRCYIKSKNSHKEKYLKNLEKLIKLNIDTLNELENILLEYDDEVVVLVERNSERSTMDKLRNPETIDKSKYVSRITNLSQAILARQVKILDIISDDDQKILLSDIMNELLANVKN